MRVYLDQFPGLTADEAMNAVSGAAAAWSAGANACSFLSLELEPGTGPGPFEAFDGVNALTFQTTTWCHRDPATGTCPVQDYDFSTPAITSVFVEKSTGRILEADIELNTKAVMWADVAAHPSGTAQDLQDVLAFEFGHVIGLDDSCWDGFTGGTAPLDGDGLPAPSCATASQTVRDTTMWPGAPPGDTKKRTLEADDVKGLCDTYPRAVGPVDAAARMDAETCRSTSDGATSGDDAASDGATSGDGVTSDGASSGDGAASDGTTGGDVAGPGHATSGDAGQDAQVARKPASAGCGCALHDGSSPAGGVVLLAELALIARRRRASRSRS
jgi:hypothetical protein